MTVVVLNWQTTVIEHRAVVVAPEDISELFDGVESMEHLVELASAEDKSKLLEIVAGMEHGGKSSCREEIAERTITTLVTPTYPEKKK